jgi:hypothetical protein
MIKGTATRRLPFEVWVFRVSFAGVSLQRPSAAKPQPKKKQDIHHEGREDPSAAEPQPKESEYLPQRRKGRKEKRNIVLNLAFLAPWRE